MKSKNKKLENVICMIAIVCSAVVLLFPVYWIILSSFQSNGDIMKLPPNFWPKKVNIDNYLKIMTNIKYVVFLKNSFIVAFATVALSAVASIFAGYGFSRYRFPGRQFFMNTILNIQIFPVTVIIISLYTFYSQMHLMDSYTGLILANFVYTLPFTVWFMKSFFDTIPTTLDEAAVIDGCGRLKTVTTIVLPLVKPGLVAASIYAFLQSWDDFMFALVIMKSDAKKTLPLGIAQSFLGEFSQDYAGMMALSSAACIPVIILFALTQKQLIGGLTAGAVKG